MKKTILQISLLCLIIFPLVCVFLMLLYIIINDTNHTGIEFLLMYVPLGLTLIASAFIFGRDDHTNKLALAACACNIIALTFFCAVDKFDIMVQYNRWLERGMPAPFTRDVFGR